jgi:hypothetical protein
MSDYRLHPITWKNVIDYNWLRLQLQLPHVWFECALEMIAEANFWQRYLFPIYYELVNFLEIVVIEIHA